MLKGALLLKAWGFFCDGGTAYENGIFKSEGESKTAYLFPFSPLESGGRSRSRYRSSSAAPAE